MSNLFDPDPEEIERAVQYLVKKIDERTWDEIKHSIAKSGETWNIDQHFAIGLYVRNLVRKGGMKIDGWYLENHWSGLVQEAMSRKNCQ